VKLKKGFNIKEYEILEEGVRVHPDAVVGKDSVIGAETTIHQSILGTVNIGKSCIIGNFSLIEDGVEIGDNSKIWHFSHIRNDVKIGKDCILGNYVYIDSGVVIGDETKIQNYVPVYDGVKLEEGVFLGPNSLTTNDLLPRARSSEGEIKASSDWERTPIHIGKDASIGAGAVLKPGVKIGEKALIGAGAMVTKDVPSGAVVVGNPGRIIRYIEGYEPK